MRNAKSPIPKALIVSVLLAGSAALGGCATEDYVDTHIAAVNARIDQTDARVGGLETRVNEVNQKTDAAAAAAQAAGAAAQSASSAAASASSDAQRANEGVSELRPLVAHLERHHKYSTWRDVNPIHRKKQAAKRTSRKKAKRANKS